MSKNMKRKFNFVNVEGGVNTDIVNMVDITKTMLVASQQNTQASAAA